MKKIWLVLVSLVMLYLCFGVNKSVLAASNYDKYINTYPTGVDGSEFKITYPEQVKINEVFTVILEITPQVTQNGFDSTHQDKVYISQNSKLDPGSIEIQNTSFPTTSSFSGHKPITNQKYVMQAKAVKGGQVRVLYNSKSLQGNRDQHAYVVATINVIDDRPKDLYLKNAELATGDAFSFEQIYDRSENKMPITDVTFKGVVDTEKPGEYNISATYGSFSKNALVRVYGKGVLREDGIKNFETKIQLRDITLLENHVVKGVIPEWLNQKLMILIADMNGDGKLDDDDTAILMQKYLNSIGIKGYILTDNNGKKYVGTIKSDGIYKVSIDHSRSLEGQLIYTKLD